VNEGASDQLEMLFAYSQRLDIRRSAAPQGLARCKPLHLAMAAVLSVTAKVIYRPAPPDLP
jgi:hypothetical protein